MKAPFPWFGGKSKVAPIIWDRFGDVPNYVEPFFGSGAVLLNRPTESGTETINDLDCMVANFWRALQHDPEALAGGNGLTCYRLYESRELEELLGKMARNGK